MSTFLIVPFDRIKVNLQISGRKGGSVRMLQEILRRDGFRSLYRGWSATLFREVPGYGIYFSIYENYRQWSGKNYLRPAESFLLGSFCVAFAWLLVYPSDPIKTIMQYDNVKLSRAVQLIWQENGLSGFYRGLYWGLLRASILHGGVFLGYETTRRAFYAN